MSTDLQSVAAPKSVPDEQSLQRSPRVMEHKQIQVLLKLSERRSLLSWELMAKEKESPEWTVHK